MADMSNQFNADTFVGILDEESLNSVLLAEGEDFQHAVRIERPHLFSGAAFFVSTAQMDQMRAIIAAVERVVALPAWQDKAVISNKGVFYGYDFHLNDDGAHLIEINTNAGGAFLNAMLIASQHDTKFPGNPAVVAELESAFIEMFKNEWRLMRGDAPLRCIAIVDEQPELQYLYPEFVLAQHMFERAGWDAQIADPSELELRDDGLHCRGRRIDLVYNRLTDFTLKQYDNLIFASSKDQVVLTPHPIHHACYADKRKLALLTDPVALRDMGVDEMTITTLVSGIPQARLVQVSDRDFWWAERKQWFFKPATGFGSKGSYSGAKLTKRVFEEIMQGGYVAQRMAVPGERILCSKNGEAQAYKSDVRCYVYDSKILLLAARLYQGQTTNFRTAGGGFAVVRVVE